MKGMAQLVWMDEGDIVRRRFKVKVDFGFLTLGNEVLSSDETFRFAVPKTSIYTLSCYDGHDDLQRLIWTILTKRAFVAGQTVTAVGRKGDRLDKLDWKPESLYLNEAIRGLRSTIKDLEAMG